MSTGSISQQYNLKKKKFPESSKSQNLNLSHSGNYVHNIYIFNNYLHSVYIVLGIITNRELI